MLHKPANYECSHKTQHHPTIYSLLPHPLVDGTLIATAPALKRRR